MSKDFPTTPLTRLTPSTAPIHALTFSSGSGQYLLTGSADRSIRLYNPTTSRLIQTYAAHGYGVLDLAVAADNRTFVSCGGDKTVFVWDVETGGTVRRFAGHVGRVNGVALGGGDGGESVVVSGSFDGTVKVWDLRSRSDHRPIVSFAEARDSVSCVDVLGAEIFAGSVDGRVRVYDLVSGNVEIDTLGASVTSVTPAKAADCYLVSTLDSRLRLMDRKNGKCLQTFKDDGVNTAKPNGPDEATHGYKNETYRIRSTLAMGDGVAMSGSEDGKVVVWDVLDGAVRERLWHKEEAGGGEGSKRDVVSAVAWNQMRKMWASAGGDGTVVVWGYG